MMGKLNNPKPALGSTLSDYSDSSTVHGVSYILNKDIPCLDRLVWLCLVVAGLVYAVYMSIKSYNAWLADPVLTTLKDTASPITHIAYPAITVCSAGLNMLAVEKIL